MSDPALEQWEAAKQVSGAPRAVAALRKAGDALAEAYRAGVAEVNEYEKSYALLKESHDIYETRLSDMKHELVKAEAENKRLVQSNRDDQISFLRGQLREAKAENERLQAALEWYARKAVWVQTNTGGGHHNASLADLDRGKHAREALAEIEKEAGR